MDLTIYPFKVKQDLIEQQWEKITYCKTKEKQIYCGIINFA